jgi:hypothetical protein
VIIVNNNEYFFVKNIEDIEHSSSNSLIIFEYDEKLITYCKKNSISFGIIFTDIIQMVIGANSGAKYLLFNNRKKIKKYQKIIEHYMYDSRLLLISDDINDIKFIAKKRIDGIIFKKDEF